MPSKPEHENGSFRDSSGFVFYSNGTPYRAISAQYQQTFKHFITSGLYAVLITKKYLIPHSDVSESAEAFFIKEYAEANIYKIIQPELIPFISYSYEWCFSQLKAAALLTLKIQEEALKHGMTLKDASAFNIQFIGCRPVFIDTLSFEILEAEKPWVAYKQFCQHFLAPLALSKYNSLDLQQLSRQFIDGIPLDLTSKLLPVSSYLNAGLAIHIHLHAKIASKYGAHGKTAETQSRLKTTKAKQLGILNHIQDGILALQLKSSDSQWSDYYKDNSYSESALTEKKNLVAHWVDAINPRTIWDIGCNTGMFSEIVGTKSNSVIAFDSDAKSVEHLYKKMQNEEEAHVLPLVIDIANPTPAIGWAGMERKSLFERGPADAILALALVHHLTISHGIPFCKIASCFSRCTDNLIIEFVPKEDPQTQRLLVTRKDVFDTYNSEGFLNAFSEYFTVVKRNTIADSGRELFWMKKKHQAGDE